MALRAVDDHPKLSRLKSLLKCGRGEALGYLEATWHFAGRYTPQGNIGKYSDEEIEAWIEWAGEPGKLIQALLTAGWLDKSVSHRLIVHHWHDHADDATKLALKRKSLDFVTNVPDYVPTVSGQDSDAVDDISIESGLPGAGPVPEPVPEPNTLAIGDSLSPVVETFLLNRGEFGLTEKMLDDFTGIYPAVNIRQSFREIKGWCIANPTKRKTKSGALKFVNGWLAREQNRGAPPPASKPGLSLSNPRFFEEPLSRMTFVNANGGTNGANKPSPTRERVDRGVGAVAKFLEQRGVIGTRTADGANGPALPEPGHGSVGGGLSGGLRATGAEAFPDGGKECAGPASHQAGPTILPPAGRSGYGD